MVGEKVWGAFTIVRLPNTKLNKTVLIILKFVKNKINRNQKLVVWTNVRGLINKKEHPI